MRAVSSRAEEDDAGLIEKSQKATANFSVSAEQCLPSGAAPPSTV